MLGSLFIVKSLDRNIMSKDNSQNILFVVNPVAGGGAKTNIEEEVKSCIRNNAQTCNYHLYETTGKNDQQQILSLIEKHKPNKVAVAGGDGTIKMVAELLLDKNIPLAMIPTGSANGMATELDIPIDISESIACLLRGVVYNMDVIMVNNELCLHLSDIGMNAQIVKYYQENNWRGKLGYLRGAIKMLFRKRHMQLTIHKDGESIQREAFMVVLANARMYGTKVIINPNGDIFDGVFEIVLIKRLNFLEILKMFLRITDYDPTIIESIPAQSVNIKVRKSIYFQVDGEYRGKKHSISAEVKKGALPIILPS